MKLPLQKGSPDDFQTPPIALTPLYPYLNPDWTIWEPACGKGNLVRGLQKNNYSVVGTDLYCDFGNEPLRNFLDDTPSKVFDCIITNPPFSLKQQFLERCYALEKPFALLLPLTTFETAKRQKLFKKNGVEVIFFDRRINFETPNKVEKSSAWFATAWFTHGLNIGRELSFEVLPSI